METQHFVLQLSNDGALTIATLYSQLLSTENDFYQLLRMRIRDMVARMRLRCCVDAGWWLRAQFREMKGRLRAARKVETNMARNSAGLKLSCFPLPEAEGRKVRSLLEFSVIDPCAGRGTALNLILAGAPVLRFGVELDTRRAEETATTGIRWANKAIAEALGLSLERMQRAPF
jgi:hypothetical protein